MIVNLARSNRSPQYLWELMISVRSPVYSAVVTVSVCKRACGNRNMHITITPTLQPTTSRPAIVIAAR